MSTTFLMMRLFITFWKSFPASPSYSYKLLLSVILLFTFVQSSQPLSSRVLPLRLLQNVRMSTTSDPTSSSLTNESLSKFRSIVQTFQANRFQPSNIFTASEHYQTIIGSGALSVKLNGGNPPRPFKTTTESFDTPDGDVFEVDYTENFEASDDVVIILHGLESSPKGILVTRFATAFLDKGFGCCLFGFRGCNGNPPK